MSDNDHRESRALLVLGIIVLPLLVLGMFLYRMHIEKEPSAFAQSSQAEQPAKPAVEKTVLTSPLGQMGWHPNDPNALANKSRVFFKRPMSSPLMIS